MNLTNYRGQWKSFYNYIIAKRWLASGTNYDLLGAYKSHKQKINTN